MNEYSLAKVHLDYYRHLLMRTVLFGTIPLLMQCWMRSLMLIIFHIPKR